MWRVSDEDEEALPCFKCFKKLESAMPGFMYNQPSDAVRFIATGHYGSTVFDPMHGGIHLEINICDECMKEHKGLVIRVATTRQEPTYDVEPWNPDLIDD